jgi:hypothetical protein
LVVLPRAHVVVFPHAKVVVLPHAKVIVLPHARVAVLLHAKVAVLLHAKVVLLHAEVVLLHAKVVVLRYADTAVSCGTFPDCERHLPRRDVVDGVAAAADIRSESPSPRGGARCAREVEGLQVQRIGAGSAPSPIFLATYAERRPTINRFWWSRAD